MKKQIFSLQLIAAILTVVLLTGCQTAPGDKISQPAQSLNGNGTIYTIYCSLPNGKGALGTTFALTKSGLFVTAAHVARGATECQIKDHTLKIVWQPTDIQYNNGFGLDVAFLKTDGEFTPVQFAGSFKDTTATIKGYFLNTYKEFNADFVGQTAFKGSDIASLIYKDKTNDPRDSFSGSPVFIGDGIIGVFSKKKAETNELGVIGTKDWLKVAESLKDL